MTRCKGILSYTLLDGSKDECLIIASSELEFYNRVASTAFQIKELYFNGEECEMKYTGDFKEGIIEMLSTDNFNLFLNKLVAIAKSKYRNGIDPLK